MSDRTRQEMHEAFEADYFAGLRDCPGMERVGEDYRAAHVSFAWRTWQAAWTASRQKALQEAAKVCEDRRDLREEARATLAASDAMRAGDAEEFMRRMRHEADVRLFNSALDKAASAIRNLCGSTRNEGDERG